MSEKFMNLNQEKQDRIINAAMKEFAEMGYDNASTNEIVKKAEISKGLLFHYFSNKKDLYLFLYDYCVDLMMNEFYKKIDLSETDFFVRFRQIQLIKWELLLKYPEIFAFLQLAYQEESSEVKINLEQRNKELALNATTKLFEGIDSSKFKDGLDLQRIINTIVWTFQGFADHVLDKKTPRSVVTQVEYESMFAEADLYIEMFKTCFYKPEFL